MFGEDLKQGRLVSTNEERLWPNLRGPLPVFDGDVVVGSFDAFRDNHPAAYLRSSETKLSRALEVLVLNNWERTLSYRVCIRISEAAT